ncbi:MAG: nitrous oxide reductase accessory protein NosL [Burkholderiales bacterium RIFCSPLOWO2_02_FULL_57_36]|nr:MAG: nitrous oxide reductase accessory protein NosL [Burkholderiales bacterium RIFCSPLOWO2_02_FULL_57_36]
MEIQVRVNKLAGSLALLILLAACSKSVQQAMPQEPDSGTACSLDGMVLKDYPGPKAQIHYAEGAPDFFCDLMELFASLLAPEQKRPVSGIFVQDMGKALWENPEGHWIDAKTAVYVAGSRKNGSMGATFGAFASLQDAEEFVKKEGGRIVQFEQVTPEMVNLHSGAAHDQKMH